MHLGVFLLNSTKWGIVQIQYKSSSIDSICFKMLINNIYLIYIKLIKIFSINAEISEISEMYACICVCVYIWYRAITMNADRPLWLYGPYLYDYHLNYPTHQCVITDIQQSVWMFGDISVCLAIRACTWVCTTLHTKLFFFYLSFYCSNYSYCIFSGQINHLYDV